MPLAARPDHLFGRSLRKIGGQEYWSSRRDADEVDGIRRAPVAAPPSPLYSPAANSNNSGVSTQARPEDVKARERRQHELGLIINGLTTTREQKQAAHEELASIGAFGTCNLSESDRKRRDGLYSDLGSLVLQRRSAAFAPLRALLSSCEKI